MMDRRTFLHALSAASLSAISLLIRWGTIRRIAFPTASVLATISTLFAFALLITLANPFLGFFFGLAGSSGSALQASRPTDDTVEATRTWRTR